jgi:hypothetical protein
VIPRTDIRHRDGTQPAPGLGLERMAAQLLVGIGCDADSRPGGRVLRTAREAVAAVERHVRPRAELRSYRVGEAAGRVLVDEEVELRSPKLARVLAPCHRIVVFVVTLGPGIDELVDDAMCRRPHLGLMLDTAASMAAERQADRLTHLLGGRLDPGLGLTLRYSPGYCDWPLREQSKLFDLLPERPAGATLSTDYLMTPRKSVSGVIGIGPRRAVRETGCACKHCSRKDCVNRRS